MDYDQALILATHDIVPLHMIPGTACMMPSLLHMIARLMLFGWRLARDSETRKVLLLLLLYLQESYERLRSQQSIVRNQLEIRCRVLYSTTTVVLSLAKHFTEVRRTVFVDSFVTSPAARVLCVSGNMLRQIGTHPYTECMAGDERANGISQWNVQNLPAEL